MDNYDLQCRLLQSLTGLFNYFGENMSFHQLLWDYSASAKKKEDTELLIEKLNALVDAGENPLLVPEVYPKVFGLSTLQHLDAVKFASGLGMFSIGAGLKAYYKTKQAKDNPPINLTKQKPHSTKT
jgi:hypothetical protein